VTESRSKKWESAGIVDEVLIVGCILMMTVFGYRTRLTN
jgi:hypothetical protein